MPAIVGAVQIIALASSGVFNIGDVHKIAPLAVAKTFAGAGSFNTGTDVKVSNNYSNITTYDYDNIDQPTFGNV